MFSLFFSFVSFCLLASVRGDFENGTFNDGSSSCSAISDASAFLQSRLGVASDAARMNASDEVGDTVRHGVGVAANRTQGKKKKEATDLQKTGGRVSPLISCGKTFYVLGHSDVWIGNCFCYKLVMCDVLYQHQPTVDCDTYSNERCATDEKDWTPENAKGFWPPLPSDGYWNTVIGQHPVTSANGLTQKYSDGTQKRSCDTDDEKRETSIEMVVDDNKTEVSMLVTEPDLRCSYHVELVGPLQIFGATTTTTTYARRLALYQGPNGGWTADGYTVFTVALVISLSVIICFVAYHFRMFTQWLPFHIFWETPQYNPAAPLHTHSSEIYYYR